MLTCRIPKIVAGAIAAVLTAVIVVGCAGRNDSTMPGLPASDSGATGAAAESAVQAGNADSAGGSDITGVWQGTTLASCPQSLPSRCNAQQNVTITLLQGNDSKFTGKYKCSYGNMDCYHMNDQGKVIDVATIGKRMNIRVLMPDGTSCIFTGLDENQSVNGGYSCYQGGSQIEQGVWRARRSY
jgi:hypothetical protein